MKQSETPFRRGKVAFLLALGVFLVWSGALVQRVVLRLPGRAPADSSGNLEGSSSLAALTLSPSDRLPKADKRAYGPGASSAPSWRENRLALAQRAAAQAAQVYQQVLQTTIPTPPAGSELTLAASKVPLPLPQSPFPWPGSKPAWVVEPASVVPSKPGTPSRALRLTLPHHLFADPKAASEAAQLIALQLVEQGYRPTLVISGEEESPGPASPAGRGGPASVSSPAEEGKPSGNVRPGGSPASERPGGPGSSPPTGTSPGQGTPEESPLPGPVASLPPSPRPNPTQDILTVLREGVKAEFRAYQALPAMQTEELARYFSGPAYQSAVAQLQSFQATGYLLSNPNNPSFSRFQGITGKISINGDTALVTGRERRALHWYVPTLQGYAPHTGQRQDITYQYRLQRQEERWKIVQRTRL